MIQTDQHFLHQAFLQAELALQKDEVPVGAIIVLDDNIIGIGHNNSKSKNNLAHAEIIAIHNACTNLGQQRLDGATLYVTLEPCMMCLGAIINTKIKRIVYGASEKKTGMLGGLANLLAIQHLTHNPITTYIRSFECEKILKDFFEKKRI